MAAFIAVPVGLQQAKRHHSLCSSSTTQEASTRHHHVITCSSSSGMDFSTNNDTSQLVEQRLKLKEAEFKQELAKVKQKRDMRRRTLERQFRSYRVMEQHITTGQRKALKSTWGEIGLDFNSLEPWDFPQVFGREAPGGVVLDIGFGTPPSSLIDMARLRPDTDFVGVEVQKPFIGACAVILERYRVLSNIRLYNGDVFNALNEMVPDRSISEICVFFPDEFADAEDAKRRLIRPLFIELAIEKLQPGGLLRIATEWDNYARHIELVMQKYPQMWGGLLEQRPPDRPYSEFEKQGMRKGCTIYDYTYVLRTLRSSEELSNIL